MGPQNPLSESLENSKIDASALLDAKDSAFVLEPEFRPKTKHNEFYESPTDQIPTIDLSPLRVQNQEGIKKLVEEIGKAAEDWGFFQVVNHGIPLSLIDRLEETALAFFSLPLEEKNKSMRTFQRPIGYYHHEMTKNHRDWKEAFDFIVRDSTSFLNVDGTSKDILTSQWPAIPAEFRETCLKYATATETLAYELLGLLSQSLGLPAEYFHKYFSNHTSTIRVNYYPPCPIPDRVLGVSRHTDWGALTVLVQDETGGLQVMRKDGEWIGVKPRRDAFVINIGDSLQVWSNDKFRSIEHQVVVNENKARFSFPLSFKPDTATDIFPVPELLDEDHPARYTKYNFGSFMRKKVNGSASYHQDGKNIQITDFAINR